MHYNPEPNRFCAHVNMNLMLDQRDYIKVMLEYFTSCHLVIVLIPDNFKNIEVMALYYNLMVIK